MGDLVTIDRSIVVFTCNWEAFSGLENAGRRRLPTPVTVQPIKVACLGRVSPGTVLNAFEQGAAGVMLAGCPPENCRYEFGSRKSAEVFAVARDLVRQLGYPEGSLQKCHIAAGDGETWSETMVQFSKEITRKGPPVPSSKMSTAANGKQGRPQLAHDIVDANRAWYCLDCGKCSSACPVTPWEDGSFASPRLLVEKAADGKLEELFEAPLFWSCTTCGRCSQICPSTVSFPEFIRDMRALARRNGRRGACTHGAVIQSWGRIMAGAGRRLQRLSWLGPSARVSDDSEILYFVGCLPYYDTLFRHLGIEGIAVANAALKIFNALGIAPQMLASERCCGHDQLWEGDVETFRHLGACNMDLILKSGAKEIVTTCPECARTLAMDYPQHIGAHGLEVTHLTQFLARQLETSASEPPPHSGRTTATFQDACRLGRHLGDYDTPRSLIAAADITLLEMGRHHQAAVCCGTSGWSACGSVCKSIQVDRLREARATRAEFLITACIKCQIHLKCAQQDPDLKNDLDLPIRDVTTVLADRIGTWLGSKNTGSDH